MNPHAHCAALAAAMFVFAAAHAQSLLEGPVPPPPPASRVPAQPAPSGAQQTPQSPTAPPPVAAHSAPPQFAAGLAAYSLFAVTPPPPKTWAKHDLVEIIINETSIQKFQQVNDLKKNYDAAIELSQFPSLEALFTEFALRNGIGASKPAIGLKSDNDYKGDAKIDRKEQITARITAEVIDVKPNGTLVLEARESIQTDREISTMVMSGVCRSEDITRNNTIQSAQVASLNIRILHEGDVKDTAEKGLIPRVLETIFNF